MSVKHGLLALLERGPMYGYQLRVAFEELALWFATPVSRGDRQRDELAIKLALALTTPGVDVRAVVQTQRGAAQRFPDEPTGALDSRTGESVLRLVRSKVDDGAAGVLVTHDVRHAAWADRVLFLRDGVVVDTSGPLESTEKLLQTPGGAR